LISNCLHLTDLTVGCFFFENLINGALKSFVDFRKIQQKEKDNYVKFVRIDILHKKI